MMTIPGTTFFRLGLMLLLFGLACLAHGESPRDRLDRLRGEIDSLSTVLNRMQRDEQSLGQRISALDQKIAARKRLLEELARQHAAQQQAVAGFDRDIRVRSQDLSSVRQQLEATRSEVEALTELIRRRAVFLYKKGESRALGFLLQAASPADFMRRQVYVSRIQARDGRNLRALRDARERRRGQERDLETALAGLRTAREKKAASVARSEELMAEAQRERKRLEQDRGGLGSMMASLQQDKEQVQQLIADRRAAVRQVEEWIASLERQRTSGEVQEITVHPRSAKVVIREVPEFSTFREGRGKLPWPLKGPILSRFGLQRNTITNTQTDNPGIDIGSPESSEVIAVQAGTCTRITYLRGFGTTILVDHGDGYYTVYAHLGDLWVSEGERVEAGRVLGTLGPSTIEGGPRLHFQIWHKREKQDPLPWLSS